MTVSRLIFVEQRPIAGRVLPIEAGLTIGREGCDIVLPDPEVSRKHAVMRVLDGGGAAIEDLGSTNGTWVNNERTEGATPVDVGDVVRFGNTLWHVAAPGATTLVVGPRADT
jgi:pSer/pThr/pTyr-binding forkhead associated (FHA) protein